MKIDVVVVALVILAVALLIVLTQANNGSGNGTVCAQDAKMCADGSYVSRTGPNCEFAPCPTQLANPASVNCIEKGGTLEILDSAQGQYGICTINGTQCEEWALFRGECP